MSKPKLEPKKVIREDYLTPMRSNKEDRDPEAIIQQKIDKVANRTDLTKEEKLTMMKGLLEQVEENSKLKA